MSPPTIQRLAAPCSARNVYYAPQQGSTPGPNPSPNAVSQSQLDSYCVLNTPRAEDTEAPFAGAPNCLDHADSGSYNYLVASSEYDNAFESLDIQGSSLDFAPFPFYNCSSTLTFHDDFPQSLATAEESPELILPTSSLMTMLAKPSNSTTKTHHPTSTRIEKRKLNTLAARRYRQERVDHINYLESALKDAQLERDALRVRVASLEGEMEVLRHLLLA